ncbi:MAG: glycosyltransferase [Clostridiaceae bacterium]|nr:glycosyltransferase [Clostridiaceae bacterium]
MKVLLLEDHSGFHKNLQEGLLELGISVNISTTGDEYKKTSSSNLYIPNSKNKAIRALELLSFPLKGINQYYNYDVVQLVNHNIFRLLKFNYNYLLLKKIRDENRKVFLSSCGTNHFVNRIKDQLRYNYIDATIKEDLNGRNKYNDKIFIRNNINIANLVDGIIPVMYTYRLAYDKQPNLLRTIPLPINVETVKFIPQKIENNKLKIFHGITREGFKGTKYIREAMEKLEENYPNDVEIIIDGKMPLDKYLEVLEETNVVVDQALSYEYGMNAIYSMAMGKVVLSGNEPECQEEFGRTDIPIINITPNVEDIYSKLEKLVLNKKSVIEIGEKSRLFVEDFHHHVKVAQQYIDTWNSVEVKK